MVKPVWALGNLLIDGNALALVERAAVSAYARGEEACGFLDGPADRPLLADRAVELENLANKYHEVDPEGHPRTGREYFKINALKFERAIREGADAGRPVKVFFHSHLDCTRWDGSAVSQSGAYFSTEDAASMTMGGGAAPSHDLAYLVTAVDAGQVTAHKLFVWDPASRSFVESRFETVSA
ncbi:MAG TPA: hypothetical protein VF989_07510 [Polyangiaceae bacterium]|jgi:proteasome lid subunit RPN8/RPN11